jgi:hypothetical protein
MLVAIAAPEAAPVTTRQANGPGLIRLGVKGSLSASNSPKASSMARWDPLPMAIDSREDPLTRSVRRRAAQVTMAGAVMERKPATTPISAGRPSSSVRVIAVAAYFIAGILSYRERWPQLPEKYLLPGCSGQTAACSRAGKRWWTESLFLRMGPQRLTRCVRRYARYR